MQASTAAPGPETAQPTRAADQRQRHFQAFLAQHCPGTTGLEPLPVEASSRRFHRLTRADGSTVVAMDAPPATEHNQQFVRLAQLFAAQGLRVPRILATDFDQGFLLVSDLGRTPLADLPDADLEPYYRGALDSLLRLHQVGAGAGAIPVYSAARLRMETLLFRDWLLERWLGIHPGPAAARSLLAVSNLLATSLQQQTQVTVHRDWHCRNLLQHSQDPASPGIVDFQDALVGPLAYDYASLLRDCYRRLPDDLAQRLVAHSHQQLVAAGTTGISLDEFQRDLDFTGVQRQLKALGIFARLDLRDGRSSHLADMPLTLGHLLQVTNKYPELATLHQLLRGHWQPAVLAKLQALGVMA